MTQARVAEREGRFANGSSTSNVVSQRVDWGDSSSASFMGKCLNRAKRKRCGNEVSSMRRSCACRGGRLQRGCLVLGYFFFFAGATSTTGGATRSFRLRLDAFQVLANACNQCGNTFTYNELRQSSETAGRRFKTRHRLESRHPAKKACAILASARFEMIKFKSQRVKVAVS
jgi:hypothetical protein